MNTQRVDFHYEISDERLIAYSRLSILDRLKWLDELRRFTLAARSAPAVDKHRPAPKIINRQSGLTLIELVIFIVIVSVALAGVLTVLNITTKNSADPMIRKQMLAIAEALLEEVQLQPFTWCDPDDSNAATATAYASCTTPQNTAAGKTGETRGSNAAPLNNVFDYNGESITTSITSAGMPAGYSASITVQPDAALGPVGSEITAADAVLRITVTVCHAAACPSLGADSIVLEGYRARYAPNSLP